MNFNITSTTANAWSAPALIERTGLKYIDSGVGSAMVNIEIDGRQVKANNGAMIIEAADEVGIPIARFCYHKKLSVAANCRMCLVEVDKAAKPLPACATPVTEGMKIHTRSPRALDAQRGTMEFLLINHPLDCPICDQGGECELQDVAMGYGESHSRFQEGKRVVKDKNLGPLIATDMTRCIHCTRCVRFGDEIAGIKELGAVGRGEHMEIGTYVQKAVTSEMSGNVIDLCPVGALTSKPFRYTARPWELISVASVAPHDCVGSNIYLHVRDNNVMRALPRENEAINETWISDRDRFSYEGLNSDDRLSVPLVKRDGEWRETDWETALQTVVAKLKGVITAGAPANSVCWYRPAPPSKKCISPRNGCAVWAVRISTTACASATSAIKTPRRFIPASASAWKAWSRWTVC